MTLDSLPERPLTVAELDRLADTDSIAETYEFASFGGPEGDFVVRFAIALDSGEHVGLDFGTDDCWHVVARTATFEEVATALSARSM